MEKTNVLKKYFGHSEFRDGQAELIDAILGGQDSVGIMPTGGGKSICYQIPAMLFEGITIVISPLISLMKDQIQTLKESGINAAYINSTLTDNQIDLVISNANKGQYKIIYVAPERLAATYFIQFCLNANISFIAVDEAHCVSRWGQDFRPSYSTIPQFVNKFKKRPVISAFTATATATVRHDIIKILEMENPFVALSGFDRKNLFFEVRHSQKRYEELKRILADKKELFGIIYCSTRKTVEEVCDKLNQDGFNAAKYHAGLADSIRSTNQDDFIYDRINIVVATNAFGMGIDKSNVSFVVHYNMPKDIESYYQEAGRAGRDGSLADCILLYNGQDLRTNLFLIENSEGRSYESEEQKKFLQEQERKRLKEMEIYCNTNSCLRNYILKYFGEKPSKDCENCGSCENVCEEIDITLSAQKILSCIVRTNEFYGKNMIIDILRGSKNARIMNANLDKLTTYNICKESDAQLKSIISYLAEHEYIYYTNSQFPLMLLGQRATEVLKEKATITMPQPKDFKEKTAITRHQSKGVKDKDQPHRKIDNRSRVSKNSELFKQLQTIRREIANEKQVPAFVIFSDKTLTQMCEELPTTLTEFLQIHGVGNQKLEQYGKIFINAIKEYVKEIKNT